MVVWPPGASAGTPLEFTDGQVTLDRTAQHRGGVTLTIPDVTLFPTDPSDLLSPKGTMVYVQRGIAYPDGSTELVDLGQYRIESIQRDLPSGGLTLTGWDKSRQLLDERFTNPRTLANQLVTDAILTLIGEVYPSGQTYTFFSSTTHIPKTTVQKDRWPTIQQFAQLIGCEIYPDNHGAWILREIPDPADADPVWTVDAGRTGVLVTASDVVTRENGWNGVVASGTPLTGTPPVPGIVHDDALGSPTLWGGPYGRVPAFYSSPGITTHTQAVTVATAMLRDLLGSYQSLDFSAVPNPALEPGDAITVIGADGVSQLHLLDQVVIPLSASGGAMTGESRIRQVLS